MTSQELKSRIDRLWEEFWTGGITNPLTVIEQITFLMFARLLDIRESRNERTAKRLNRSFKPLFKEDQQNLRWSHLMGLPAQEIIPHVRDKVFPAFKGLAYEEATFGEYMKNAQLMIQKPSLLVKAMEMINDLPLEQSDIKGDLYEYLLSKLTTAGINGQFRTPRHIIKFMCEVIDPKPSETLCDPACGTAGFLVGALMHIMENYSDDDGRIPDEGGVIHYTGNLLKDNQREFLQKEMFNGFDFDDTMLRVASMNMLLHGIEAPQIHYQDTLATNFEDKFPKSATNGFDIILANPPFKGSLDYEDTQPRLLAKAKTKKTELLFITLILEMLKSGGRAGVIVPDGVLFGSSKAHQAVRQHLVEENGLDAVISLPSGVFKPYAGVSTAILIFTKGSETKDVFFYDIQADGFSLDDKRSPIDQNDLPAALEAWQSRKEKDLSDRTKSAFTVPRAELADNKYDLSLSRYKEVVYEEEEFDPPKEILGRLKDLQAAIDSDLKELEEMLG
ncbi:type I restriction-modification system subunit M [Emcibacter nanhaiensis]|uniref:site-specific DNA-methyltransferase (adenine-specific) n=1 Tax=Emcibacter nanhaiensis TaxID=1505037 RepID=A0A501PTF2_9PROT|nr:type I restriction-modification system subunit M [Emcibacter nanhaiensis]TPD63036.1 SAM-dependent DNA methyltransferase [Emcibacter nanhaiensis]